MLKGLFQPVGILHPWRGMSFNSLKSEGIFLHHSFSCLTIASFFSSFIENFGTHVITSVTIGGKDVIYVKQHQSSPLSTLEIKHYVQDIGNQRFSDMEGHTSSGPMKLKDKASPRIFPYFFVYLP